MVKILLVLLTVTFAYNAHSACMNYADLKINATSMDKLYGELDRMICLHNEQAQDLANQEARIRELERQVDQLGTLALQHELDRTNHKD